MESQELSLTEDLAHLRRAQEGDAEAFRALVGKYESPIYDLCARVLRQDQEAADVTQETFLKLYHHLPDYKVGHKLRNWLYTIALNLCRNRLRHQKVIRFLSLDFSTSASDESSPFEIAESGLSVSGQLEEKEATQLFDRLVETLPAKERETFVLKYIRSLSDEEIASILEVSVNHVRVRLSRSRTRLWEQFGKAWNPDVISQPEAGI